VEKIVLVIGMTSNLKKYNNVLTLIVQNMKFLVIFSHGGVVLIKK